MRAGLERRRDTLRASAGGRMNGGENKLRRGMALLDRGRRKCGTVEHGRRRRRDRGPHLHLAAPLHHCSTAPSPSPSPSRYRIGMAPLSLLLLLDVPISSSSLGTLVNLGTRTFLSRHQRPQPINNGTYWAQHLRPIPIVLCWYLCRLVGQ